jgi:hypothetical protein
LIWRGDRNVYICETCAHSSDQETIFSLQGQHVSGRSQRIATWSSYFTSIWPDSRAGSEIVLKLLSDDFSIDVEVWDPILVHRLGRHLYDAFDFPRVLLARRTCYDYDDGVACEVLQSSYISVLELR